jgi:glycosyltransferase involved in cell wall biosynthesis
MLCKLILATQGDGLEHEVVSLTEHSLHEPRLAEARIPVAYLGMRQGIPDPRAIVRLARLLRRSPPDVIQSWMAHANLLSGLAALAAGSIPVVWGIRHSVLDPQTTKRLSRWTTSLCARLSGVLPTGIVCCAEAALRSHVALGYRSDRMVVIPNGFEVGEFAMDASAGARVRSELSIPAGALVVGFLGRFHLDKDPRNFIAAAKVVTEGTRDAVFLLAGEGMEWSNAELSAWVDECGLRSRVHLLGARADVSALLSAMNVLACSSRTEAFPNVLGEALLCGVPCVATDCGDSREIVGPSGRIVPPQDPAALGKAILELLALDERERAALGVTARDRMRARYDIRQVAQRYAELYREVCDTRPVPDARAGRHRQVQ